MRSSSNASTYPQRTKHAPLSCSGGPAGYLAYIQADSTPGHRPTSGPGRCSGIPGPPNPQQSLVLTLGVLLVELCLDNTFEQIRQESQDSDFVTSLGVPGVTSSVPPLSDFDIATGCIDEVLLREGELYGDAVQRCLRCEFPGRDVTKDFNFQEFRKKFFEGVVAPVQATFESSI